MISFSFTNVVSTIVLCLFYFVFFGHIYSVALIHSKLLQYKQLSNAGVCVASCMQTLWALQSWQVPAHPRSWLLCSTSFLGGSMTLLR